MIEFEDILDDATRYLQGKMDKEEAAFFDQLLNQNPYLEKDLRFMELVQKGLKNLEEKRNDNRKLVYKKSLIGISILTAIITLLLLFFWPDIEVSSKPKKTFRVIPAKNNFSSTEEAYVYIDQLSGAGDNRESDRGHGVFWLPNGDVAFTGTFEGEGELGGTPFRSEGKKDIIFGIFNLENGFNWVATIGSKENPDFGTDISSDSKGNLILTGAFGGEVYFGDKLVKAMGVDDMGDRDFFIAKFNQIGELIWVDHAGGIRKDHKQTGVNTGFAVTADHNDNIIVSGIYIGDPILSNHQLPIGGPNGDLFIAKYSPSGEIKWVNSVTGKYMIYGKDVETDNEGNIFVTGAYGHHNLSGWAKFGGDTILHSRGGRDIFLVKYNPEGDLLWARSAGSNQETNGQEFADGIAVDALGNSIITGGFVGQAFFETQALITRGGRDIFLAKYDPDGKLLWANRAGGPHGDGRKSDKAYDVAVAPDESIIITGCFTYQADFGTETLSTTGNHNFYLAKYSSAGKILWVTQFEALEGFVEAEGFAVDINSYGDIVVTGFFSGTIGIGDKVLKSKGPEDIFILIFNKEGKVISMKRMIAYHE